MLWFHLNFSDGWCLTIIKSIVLIKPCVPVFGPCGLTWWVPLFAAEPCQELYKFLVGREGSSTADRMRILRLIENMTLGRNAVGYLTESMHGAGSPQAQRVQMARGSQIEYRKKLAQKLAGIILSENMQQEDVLDGYLGRVFKPEKQ
jgi:hypothetical protein